METITAIIADDEPLMRERLRKALRGVWPALTVLASVTNGVDAIAAIREHRPTVAFLDIQMPGKTGLEVAAEVGADVHIVFVTAFDEYALAAFDQGAVDYVLKPVEQARLAETVKRVQRRLHTGPADLTQLLAGLLNQRHGKNGQASSRTKWLRASLGNTTKLINIDEVLFFQSDTKYTRIVLRDSEALVRTPLKELLDDLDPDVFWQVHRGTVVNANAIDRAVREGPETLVLHLKEHAERLRVSRQYFALFKQA